MRKWERYVADRLEPARLPHDVQHDVIAEIAAHLEECEGELRDAGVADARAATLQQVQDWRRFGRHIRRAKERNMNMKNVRRVMLPGAAAALASIAALKLFVYLLIVPTACGQDMTCIRVSADGPAYLPWLATLPLAGALAAALARQQGAGARQRLIASLFPAVYLAAEMVVFGGVFFWRIPIYWVLIPAVACALGAWPLLGGRAQGITALPVATTQP